MADGTQGGMLQSSPHTCLLPKGKADGGELQRASPSGEKRVEVKKERLLLASVNTEFCHYILSVSTSSAIKFPAASTRAVSPGPMTHVDSRSSTIAGPLTVKPAVSE